MQNFYQGLPGLDPEFEIKMITMMTMQKLTFTKINATQIMDPITRCLVSG